MAAGESKRMEGIKQLLPWKDSNLLLETIKTVKKSNANSIHVVLGAHAELIKKECKLSEKDVTISVNPNWSNGLGSSIAFVVENLINNNSKPDGILICLADQPLLSSKYLNLLIQSFEDNPSKIITTNYKNKAGVPALFPKSLYPKLVVLNGDQGAKKLLTTNLNNIVLLDAGNQIFDVDTKHEYEKLKQNTNFKNEA